MKKTILSFGIATILALTSCASYHSGTLQNSSSLSSANFSYIKKGIKGVKKCTYILGIGGLSKTALTSNSRADMYANAHLKDGQAIINVSTTVSYKVIAGPIYMQRIATTTGYIIEFVK